VCLESVPSLLCSVVFVYLLWIRTYTAPILHLFAWFTDVVAVAILTLDKQFGVNFSSTTLTRMGLLGTWTSPLSAVKKLGRDTWM
jgi:hypothetical protein